MLLTYVHVHVALLYYWSYCKEVGYCLLSTKYNGCATFTANFNTKSLSQSYGRVNFNYAMALMYL